jgi:hypothetical protein
VVTLRYQPASVALGLASSGVGVLALIAFFAIPLGLRRRRAGAGEHGSTST